MISFYNKLLFVLLFWLFDYLFLRICTELYFFFWFY